MFKRTNYFQPHEQKCRCGCGAGKFTRKLLRVLNSTRRTTGRKMVVTSGYRCERHNQRVGGVEDSFHMHGTAADIACSTLLMMFEIAIVAAIFGARGIGIYPDRNFVHIDVGVSKSRPKRLWPYIWVRQGQKEKRK